MKMKKTGFSLIEILIVVGILATVAIIGTTMFFSILKSAAKTRILAEVKQNGNYALGVMERAIRNGRDPIGGGSWITITAPNDIPIRFSCEDSNDDGITDIASDSASLISNKVEVQSCSFNIAPGGPDEPDVVTINFTLSQAGTTTRPEEEAMVDFEATVTLRNY